MSIRHLWPFCLTGRRIRTGGLSAVRIRRLWLAGSAYGSGWVVDALVVALAGN